MLSEREGATEKNFLVTILHIVQSGATKTPLILRKGLPRMLSSDHADQTDVSCSADEASIGKGKHRLENLTWSYVC